MGCFFVSFFLSCVFAMPSLLLRGVPLYYHKTDFSLRTNIGLGAGCRPIAGGANHSERSEGEGEAPEGWPVKGRSLSDGPPSGASIEGEAPEALPSEGATLAPLVAGSLHPGSFRGPDHDIIVKIAKGGLPDGTEKRSAFVL